MMHTRQPGKVVRSAMLAQQADYVSAEVVDHLAQQQGRSSCCYASMKGSLQSGQLAA
jgi:hypothetical protein